MLTDKRMENMTNLIYAFHRRFAKAARNQNVKVDNVNVISSA